MMPAPARRALRGLTVLELVVVLAMVALLCSLAYPSFTDAVGRLRADLLRMQLVSVFNSARSTAITRFQPIGVCPSDDGRQCGSEWSRGWIIHRDHGPGTPTLAPEDILHFRPGYRDTQLLARSSQGRTRLRFQADGRSGGSTLTLDICAGETMHSQVIVNNVGRTRSTRLREHAECRW
jgi:type IV fimbrial biogenesis protein FimT